MDVKDVQGRALSIKVESVDGDKVTFATKNGKTYTYEITKFSVVDQLALRKWQPPVGSDSPVIEDAKLTEGKETAGGMNFQSKHFEFETLGAVSKELVEEVSPHFEAVHWAFMQLPTDVKPKPAGTHFKVKLFAERTDFEVVSKEKLGEGQPAVYSLGDDTLSGPMGLVKSGPALSREIAYLLLGERLTTLPPWLAVAIAEYVASAPFKENRLDLVDPFPNMLAHLDSVYGLRDKNMPMLKPTEVMALDYGKLRADGLEGDKARSSALLTYYYFTFLDGKGKGMERFMLAMKTKTPPDEAMAILLNERNEAQLAD